MLELQQKKQTVQINNIFFDFDKAELKKESFPELNRLVELLNTNKHVKIIIEGHTDNSGTNERNIELSKQRAEAVKQYLIANNIAANRITVAFFGAMNPIAPNDSELNRAKNRRVNIVFQN